MIQKITLSEAYIIRHEIENTGKMIYCVQAVTGITYQITFPPQRNEMGGWFSVIMISQQGQISVVHMPGRRPVYVREGTRLRDDSPSMARIRNNE